MARTHNDSLLRYQRLQKLYSFLYNVNVATSRQIYRATFNKMEINYALQNQGKKQYYNEPPLIRQMVKEKMLNTYTPYLGPTLYAPATGTSIFATYEGAENKMMTNLVTSTQQHNLGITSVVSQLYGMPDYDALGLGLKDWQEIYKPLIQQGMMTFIGESRIMKVWKRSKGFNNHETYGSIESNQKDSEQIDGALNAAETCDSEETGFENFTLDYSKTVFDKERSNIVAGYTTVTDKSRVQMHDYRSDGVIVFNDNQDAQPYCIAVEVELTSKSIDAYIGKLSAYQSELGLGVYWRVIYYCTRQRTVSRINAALTAIAGGNPNDFNKNGQIVVVLMNGDNSSLSQGGDMQIAKYANLVYNGQPSYTDATITSDYPMENDKSIYKHDKAQTIANLKNSKSIRRSAVRAQKKQDNQQAKINKLIGQIQQLEDYICKINPSAVNRTPQELTSIYGPNGIQEGHHEPKKLREGKEAKTIDYSKLAETENEAPDFQTPLPQPSQDSKQQKPFQPPFAQPSLLQPIRKWNDDDPLY